MSLEIDLSQDNADLRLLEALRPTTEALYDRHMAKPRVWYPHEYIPHSDAQDFDPKAPWNPADYALDPGLRSALIVNLLTEDNLPYYTHTIRSHGDSIADHPFNAWTNRWTAEEGRHSMVMRDWIIATHALDPKLVEDYRMIQMAGGKVPQPPSFAETIAYVSFQELATQVSHRNTGQKLGSEHGGSMVMAMVAGDETKHYIFYRDLTAAALQIAPEMMLRSIYNQLHDFAMPGTGIPNFKLHSVNIAAAGIYNARIHRDAVVKPTLDAWDLENIESKVVLSDEAKKYRDKIINFHANTLGRIAAFQDKQLAKVDLVEV